MLLKPDKIVGILILQFSATNFVLSEDLVRSEAEVSVHSNDEAVASTNEGDNAKSNEENVGNNDGNNIIYTENANVFVEKGYQLEPEEMEKFKIWKNGVIPYYIDVVSFNDKAIREKIRGFLQLVNRKTGLKFLELPRPPADEGTRWVMFLNRRGLLGCADHSVKDFTNKGVQKVVLGYDCMFRKGEMAEAVMSIVGIPAQHNAPDRDDYVIINFDNVLPDKKYMFEKVSEKDWLFHDLQYDFNSVTHFDYIKYSANGHTTIEPTDPQVMLYPRVKFSQYDIIKIHRLYNFILRNSEFKDVACSSLFKQKHVIQPLNTRDTEIMPREKHCRYLGNCTNRTLEASSANPQDWRDKSINNSNNRMGDHKHANLKQTGNDIDLLSLLSDYHSDDYIQKELYNPKQYSNSGF